MLPKKAILFSALVLAFLGSSVDCFALGDASQCVMTVKKIELRNTAGDWLTLTEKEQSLDLFSQDPSISIVNNGNIPPGTYVNCKVTLSETITVAGSDGPNKTRQGGEIIVGGSAARAADLPGEILSLNEVSPTWNTKAEGAMIEHLNLNYEDRDDVMSIYSKRDFKRELKVKEGSKIRVILRMDLKRTMNYVWANYFNTFPPKDTIYFLPPHDVSELSVKVDAVTAIATSDIEWAF